LADREKRKKFFIAVGAIIAIPLLFILMVFYIITAPFRWVTNLFSSDDVSHLDELRVEMGYPSWTLEGGVVEGFYCPFPGIDWLATSSFGMRINPVTGVQELHSGVDISWYNAYGVPIGAVADGIVTFAGYSPTAGNWVVIYHGDMGEYIEMYIADGMSMVAREFRGVVSVYMHNSSNLVATGDEVEAGDTIGLLGSTGQSTGPHLHLEIRTGGFNRLTDVGRASGVAQDPLVFIGLPSMRTVVDEDDEGDE